MIILVGIQARSNSTRFPGKIFEMIGDKSVLEHVFKTCESVGETAVLGPMGDVDLALETVRIGAHALWSADEENVFRRYERAVQKYDGIIRVTADCWNIPKEMIEETMKLLESCDYVSNCIYRSFPEGWDCQGVTKRGLEWIAKHARDKEHVFAKFEANEEIRNKFVKAGMSIRQILNSQNCIFEKNSIDTKEDLERAREVYARTHQ